MIIHSKDYGNVILELREEVEVEDQTPCESHFSLTMTRKSDGAYVFVEGQLTDIAKFLSCTEPKDLQWTSPVTGVPF